MMNATNKTLLATALYDLLQTRPIQDVTVLGISNHCGLSTRSFYNHFTDKYDLTNYIYYNISESCWFDGERLCSLTETYARWLEEANKHIPFLVNVYKYAGQNNIRDFVLEKERSDLRRLLVWNGHAELLNDREVSEIINYHSFALSAMLEHNCTCIPSKRFDLRIDTILSTLPQMLYDIFTASPPLPRKTHQIDVFYQTDLSWPPKLID